MTLRRLVRSWYWLVLLCTVAGAAAGFVFGAITPPSYASTVTVFISAGQNINDIQVAQALTPSYAELATSRTLLDRVIATTGVATTADKLSGEISTHVAVGTSLLEITVTDRDPHAAAALANGIAAELAKFNLQGPPATSTGSAVTLTVVDPAIPSTKSLGLGSLFSAVVGATIGFLMAVTFAFAVENVLSRTGRTNDTVVVAPPGR